MSYSFRAIRHFDGAIFNMGAIVPPIDKKSISKAGWVKVSLASLGVEMPMRLQSYFV